MLGFSLLLGFRAFPALAVVSASPPTPGHGVVPLLGGLPVVLFQVYWDQGDPLATVFVPATPSTTLTNEWTKNSQLIDGVYYRLKITAVNFIGESE